jgi:hypothetical protein
VSARVVVEYEGVKELRSTLRALADDELRADMEASVMVGAELIRRDAATRAGGSIGRAMIIEKTSERRRRVTVGIGPSRDAPHGLLLEYPTRTHTIRPSAAGALKLPGGVLRAVVRHPGTGAQPFLRPAADAQREAAMRATAAEFKRRIEARAERLSDAST